MDHAYLESTVTSTLTEALTSLSLVMAKSSSQHPIIDPIDYLGKFLLHRRQPTDLPASLVQAIDLENHVISKHRELYIASHPPSTHHEQQSMDETSLKLESETDNGMQNESQEPPSPGMEEDQEKQSPEVEPSDVGKSEHESLETKELQEREVEEKAPAPTIEENQEKPDTEKESIPVEPPQKDVEETPEQKDSTS